MALRVERINFQNFSESDFGVGVILLAGHQQTVFKIAIRIVGIETHGRLEMSLGLFHLP